MMDHLALQIDDLTFSENPQEFNKHDNALDKVIDPFMDFNLQRKTSVSSTNEAFNINRTVSHARRYKIDKNELPKVHNVLGNNHGVLKKEFKTNMSSVSLQSDESSISYLMGKHRIPTDVSVITDVSRSNLSSMSDLTRFEEDSFYKYKNQELNAKLQEALTKNEQYKFNLDDLEHKLTLDWNEKYQELLRQNAQYEGQVNYLKSQLECVLNDRDHLTKNKNPQQDLESKLNFLEKQNSDLNSKLILSSKELKQWHSEASKLESENEQLRLAQQDLKLEIESKNSILSGLKNKITEQHIQLQDSIQTKLKLSNQITSLNNEIQAVKKSEKWYVDQLHACQLAKNNAQQELMLTQSNLIANSHKIDTLNLELVRVNNLCTEIQTRAMREKEKLLHKIQKIQADFLEREAAMNRNAPVNQEIIVQFDNKNEYESALEECREQLNTLQGVVDEKQSCIENIVKDNAQHLVLITSLQKKLNEKELSYQSSLDVNRDLEQRYASSKENLGLKDQEILELRNKIVNLEVALHGASLEKLEIDDVLKNIREDFNIFIKQYNRLKEKLEEKSRVILSFEQEKQELFMENNWRVCELEELQRKVHQMEKSKVENNNKEPNDTVTTLSKHVSNLENEILKQNEMLSAREEQLLTHCNHSEVLNNEITTKENMIDELKQRLDVARNAKQELEEKLLNITPFIEELFNLFGYSVDGNFNKYLEIISTQLKSNNSTNKTDKFTQTNTQTNETLQKILNLSHDLLGDKLIACTNDYNIDNVLQITIGIISTAINQKSAQQTELERLKLTNNKVKNEIELLKSKVFTRLKALQEKCDGLNRKYSNLKNVMDQIKCYKKSKIENDFSTQTDSDNVDVQSFKLVQEINVLKNLLQTNEMNYKKQYNKFQVNTHTLLKKVRENKQCRKIAEQKLENMNRNYDKTQNEIAHFKILNDKKDLELETLRKRSEEYKNLCDKLNNSIVELEKKYAQNNVRDINKHSELEELKKEHNETKFKLEEALSKLRASEMEMSEKDTGIVEYKKQLFDEKLQISTLKKQLSSLQMCLDNANQQLDSKNVELSQLRQICDKLEVNERSLREQLHSACTQHQECKRKLEGTAHQLAETNAKDTLLLDEIKTLSCHLHKIKLELSNSQNKTLLLEETNVKDRENYQKQLDDLGKNLSELQMELDAVNSDKYFLQRLCSDLKMSLQGTVNKNKVLQQYVQVLVSETKNSHEKLKTEILNASSNINEEHINKLLEQSMVSPEKPMTDLRNCLDSLKREMASLQFEILSKTQPNK